MAGGNICDSAMDSICDLQLVEKIEEAYKVYRLNEIFLSDVADDYGKQKIAWLRLEFSRHKLYTLVEEARAKGIKWNDSEIIRKLLYPENLNVQDGDPD